MILIFCSILFYFLVFSIYIDFYTSSIFKKILKYFFFSNSINEYIIHPKDFDRFAFTTIKRKLIDEIRFRNKDKSVPLDIFDNNILDSSDNSYDYLYIQLFEYVNKTLTKQELEYFNEFKKSLDIKQTAKSLNISLATAYRLHKRVKEACEKFLMEY